MTTIWDQRFIEMAQLVSTWSKDPSTKVGAVIVRPNKTVASLGYNGLPRGNPDHEAVLANPELKLRMTVHAEINAIVNAREPLHGYTLYLSPIMPCSRCMAIITQAGISVVVVSSLNRVSTPNMGASEYYLTTEMAKTSGIILREA